MASAETVKSPYMNRYAEGATKRWYHGIIIKDVAIVSFSEELTVSRYGEKHPLKSGEKFPVVSAAQVWLQNRTEIILHIEYHKDRFQREKDQVCLYFKKYY